jgi:hypothetical protein
MLNTAYARTYVSRLEKAPKRVLLPAMETWAFYWGFVQRGGERHSRDEINAIRADTKKVSAKKSPSGMS